MYLALIATVAISTVFFPTFIGIHASSNRNWRSL
jgi:hypothetical protein